MLNIEKIMSTFYDSNSKTYEILIIHGRQVADKALKILDNLPLHYNIKVDKKFIIEASMLHDVGVCMVNNKSIGCLGKLPYICHGVEGKKLLDKIGLAKHGHVCERHVGVGLSSEDIIQMGLPLPVRDMLPISLEEKLICYSDKFFSKSSLKKEENIDSILNDLGKYSKQNIINFMKLHKYFNPI